LHANQISEKQLKALARTCSGLSTAATEGAKKQLGEMLNIMCQERGGEVLPPGEEETTDWKKLLKVFNIIYNNSGNNVGDNHFNYIQYGSEQ